MFKKLAAFALSGVIAVTSLTPTMAEANNYGRNNNVSQDELIGGLIFGAIALYALSEASKNNKKSSQKSSKKREPVRLPKPNPPRWDERGHGNGHHAGRGHRKALPTACIRRTSGGQGPAYFFGRKCMRENFRGYNNLPRRCFREFRTPRGYRVGFGPSCLRRNGYTW
ncbi:hypothetical protein [Shimia ponticola]|uniref:hypothetical protein n=1 Tax=Shimia ponticola TaxID=2582893 RepID=UPI0011BF59BE|nr:hypothetical protein [Shimia ponticola]